MKLAITGASGLIGTAAAETFEQQGWEVYRVVRRKADPERREIGWAPLSESIDLHGLDGMDAVIHLAGEPIAPGRWTRKKKNRIWESRVIATQMLCRALARLERPPTVLISASAVGFYGDRGDEWLDESWATGTGFLSEVCRYWEAAAQTAREKGVRVVHSRFGMVLSQNGGMLKTVLPVFRLGLGGPIGSGRQYWSWVALDDVVRFFELAIRDETLSGAINVVTPHPVTAREFASTLAKVLRRPAVLPFPAFAAKLLFGEMAGELLLASACVEPAVLKKKHFDFLYPELESALRAILGRNRK